MIQLFCTLMISLTERQRKILEFIQQHGSVGNRDLVEYLDGASRVTILRDIDVLLERKLIAKEGAGRSTRYREAAADVLRYIDPDAYFAQGPDERTLKHEMFSFEVFAGLHDLFTPDEARDLERANEDYRERLRRLSPDIIRKEFERLTIELSWKSSRIEGNTYSLIDTEVLLKEHKEAQGHSREEAIMILNHKKALEYIRDERSDFRRLTMPKLERIHDLVVEGLNVARGVRQTPVGIVGTAYRPLDNEHQIREALEKLIAAVNEAGDIFSKALLTIVLLSYIQPFEDGNKRTARLLGNALLLAHDACPLSYRSVNEAEYKKALILFYEQNNIRYFKELFREQFLFAASRYFLA